MNILFILPQIHKGGGQAIQALNLAEEMISKGNKITFLTFKTIEKSIDIKKRLKKFRIYYYNVFLNHMTILFAPILVNKLKILVKDLKIDVIQSFDPHLSNLIAVLLGSKLKIPVICRLGAKYKSFYENKLLRGNFLARLIYYSKFPLIFLMILELYTIKRIKILICNSLFILKALKQSFMLKIQNFKWEIIPNGVNPQKFLPNIKLPLEISKEFQKKKNIIFIGRIEDYKGVDTLIQALAIVKDNIPDIHLIIIGSYHFNPAYYKKLQKLIKSLKIMENISFLGEISHDSIPYYLNLAKILILPSYSPLRSIEEGFPNVILEAMACKCLVIASAVGGVPELIQNQKNGLLFKPKNETQLAKLLISIWTNPIKFEKIIANAWKEVTEKYTIQIVVEKYLNVYNWSIESSNKLV